MRSWFRIRLEKKWPDSTASQSVFYTPKYITGLFRDCTSYISMWCCEDLINFLKYCVFDYKHIKRSVYQSTFSLMIHEI